jgi:hypothetical protein
VNTDELLPPRSEKSGHEFVGDMVNVVVEPQVLSDLAPHRTVRSKLLNGVGSVHLTFDELDRRNVEEVFEAHELLIREGRGVLDAGEEAVGGFGEPGSVVLTREDLDTGESNARLDRRRDLKLSREGPEVRLDVVSFKGTFVPPAPAREHLRLSTGDVGDLDVLPADHGDVGVVGEGGEVEEVGEGSVAAFRVDSLELSAAGRG